MSNMKKTVAHVGELANNEMKKVEINGQEILLVRFNDNYYALGHKCPHFEGPLSEGVMNKGSVRCPWHQARFNLITGDLEEPPSLNALSKFEVRINGKEVIVEIPEDAKASRIPDMAEYRPKHDDRTFLILGAGAAGNAAAEALRQFGFEGRIRMVTKDKHRPYDRTQLSKYRMRTRNTRVPSLRSEKFYSKHHIEVQTETKITTVDRRKKKVGFTNGETITYDKLLIATGSEPKKLQVPQANLGNIYTLRTAEDARKIIKTAENASNVVIVGAGFIGMETAASLSSDDLKVTVVAPEETPFEKTFGQQIGNVFKKEHTSNGVNFELENKVKRFEGGGERKSCDTSGWNRACR